ncbi:MAG TPA: hypothetical protein VF559_07915 [Caulobacteraceae bacterium]|jgi:hypothetical protein
MITMLAMMAAASAVGEPAQPRATKVSDPNEVICFWQPVGNAGRRKVCGTRKQIEEARADLQREIRETQMRSFQMPVR